MERRGIDDFGEFVVIANASVVVRAVCRVARDGLKGKIGRTGNADPVESVPAREERVLTSGEGVDRLAGVGAARRAQSYEGQALGQPSVPPHLRKGLTHRRCLPDLDRLCTCRWQSALQA